MGTGRGSAEATVETNRTNAAVISFAISS